jgi:biotin-dependent carboxylase-like uncharacterized protein
VKALRVISPGLSTTIQDRGRPGHQRQGIPVSGALDVEALTAANIVVGNGADAAALECLYQGPELEIDADTSRVAIAGAGAALDVLLPGESSQHRIPALQSVSLPRGARIQAVVSGAAISAYLAIAGGIDVPAVLGSRSTYVRARLGGLNGRALKAGDTIELVRDIAPDGPEMRLPGVTFALPDVVGVVLGPQDDHFTSESLTTFLAGTYLVSPSSDRMGLRLTGAKLTHTDGYNIISDGIAPGSIQVPGDGLPIILLADRQTTGGYPKVATVASADLPSLGRVGPGAPLRFRQITVATAEEERRLREREMASWPSRLEPVSAATSIDPARLYGANLVSGVTDARSPSSD